MRYLGPQGTVITNAKIMGDFLSIHFMVIQVVVVVMAVYAFADLLHYQMCVARTDLLMEYMSKE